jgi:hypothetical protein
LLKMHLLFSGFDTFASHTEVERGRCRRTERPVTRLDNQMAAVQ